MDLARKHRVTYLVCLAAGAAFTLQALGDMVRAHTRAIGIASFAFSTYLAIVHKALF